MKEEILKNKNIWDADFKDKKLGNYVFVYEPVLDLIIDIIERDNYFRILDYGCGDGRFGFYLKKRLKDKTLVGADISKEALRLCGDFYDEVYLTDGLILPDKKFDFIILNSLLEHVPLDSWDSLFANINRKLEIRGGIFIIMPNKNSLRRKFTDRWQGEEVRLGHVSLVDFKFLKNKLRAYGFVNLQSSFVFKPKELPSYVFSPKGLKRLFMVLYSLLNIYPFYYLRDSFWVLAKRA